MTEEYIDIVDSKLKVVGSAPRSVVHKEGLWHQTFHCWIIRKEDKKKYVVLQRRSYNKKNHPGKLDITAAGHLISGETIQDGIREIEEEIGLCPNINEMIYLGIRLTASNVSPDDTGKIRNNEYSHVYMWANNIPITDYKIQTDEVDSLVEIEIHSALRLFSHQVKYVYCRAVTPNSPHEIASVKITLDDFIPRIDRYYEKIFIMAERYFAGKKFLAI